MWSIEFTASRHKFSLKGLIESWGVVKRHAATEINTYSFFLAPFFLKFLGFLPAVIVSSFVQILTERVPFLLIISY